MKTQNNDVPPPGWQGGYEESNPAFAYPDPDLSSIMMKSNLAHINLLQRQMAAEWPEFSWQTIPGEESSRCYQMFSPYISRIGYTNKGKVYSIICPQQGVWIKGLGTLNVEVTVTKTRGWVNESTRELAADMIVEPKVWLSPDASQSAIGKVLWTLFEGLSIFWPFPDQKKHALQLNTSLKGDPSQPIFPLRDGLTSDFKIPDFATHYDEAWTTANLEVEIGGIKPTSSELVDGFNQLLMNVFNAASGHMLAQGNVLAWNIWFRCPELVNQQEWKHHAEYWRHSIDVKHTAPTGSGTDPRFYDGSPFTVKDALIEDAVMELIKYLSSHTIKRHHPMVH